MRRPASLKEILSWASLPSRAVDPALIAMMRKMPVGSAHNTGEMEKTTEEAAKHPDAADLEKAKAYMEAFTAKYEKYYGKK